MDRKARAGKLATEIAALRKELAVLKPAPYLGSTLFIDEIDPVRTTKLVESKGEGKNREGYQRGYLGDLGGVDRLPNVSGGSYTWFENTAGREVFAWRPRPPAGSASGSPGAAGSFPTPPTRATCSTATVIPRRATTRPRSPGSTSRNSPTAPPMSATRRCGPASVMPASTSFAEKSAIFLRGGETGSAISADVLVLQDAGANRGQPRLRAPVNAKGNEETFAPVEARFVRFAIGASSSGQPCLDELEIWSGERNVALGGKPTSSGDFPNNAAHKLAHINDGQYGNGRSWIASTPGKGWVMIELKSARDRRPHHLGANREGKYSDRLATRYRIEVAKDANGPWQTVASSEGRAPVGAPAADAITYELAGLDPAQAKEARAVWDRFAPLEAERAALAALPKVYAGQFVQPKEPTKRLFRGDPLAPKEVVAPASLSVFAGSFGSFALPADAPEPIDGLPSRTGSSIRRIRSPPASSSTGSGITISDAVSSRRPPISVRWDSVPAIPSCLTGSRPSWSSTAGRSSTSTGSSSLEDLPPVVRPASRGALGRRGHGILWRFPPRRLEAEPIRDKHPPRQRSARQTDVRPRLPSL